MVDVVDSVTIVVGWVAVVVCHVMTSVIRGSVDKVGVVLGPGFWLWLAGLKLKVLCRPSAMALAMTSVLFMIHTAESA